MPHETYNPYENLRVLIVDDEPSARAILKKLFQERPFLVPDENIKVAEAFEPALSFLRQHFFHIIVTDLNFQNGDDDGGFRLLGTVADMYPPDSILKVLISGEQDIVSILNLIIKRLGFDDTQAYVQKYQNDGINIFDVLLFTKNATIHANDPLPPFINIIQRKFDRLGVNLNLSTYTNNDRLIPNLVKNLAQALYDDLNQDWRKREPIKEDNDWFRALNRATREVRIQEEFEDLFRRLFNDIAGNGQKNNAIWLSELAQGFGQARVLRVSVPTRIIDQVVKFGHRVSQSKDEVMVERRNHTLFVVDRIFNAPEIRAVSETPLLSAIRYQFAGNDQPIHSFGHIFRDNIATNPKRIANIITKLFHETCRAWYDDNNRGGAENYRFDKHYADFLRCTPKRVEEAFGIVQNYQRDGFNPVYFHDDKIVFHSIPVDGEQIHYLNPLTYLSSDKDNWRNIMTYSVNKAITHGDFNAQNILVTENDDQVWLIDFYRTGWSHIHRDFIQLESVVRFILFEYGDASLQERYEMEQFLMGQTSFDDIDRIMGLLNNIHNRPLRHTAELICHIRKLAGQYGNTAHGFKGYKVGLLFYCLNTVKFVKNNDEVEKLNAIHALLLACMLNQDLYPQ